MSQRLVKLVTSLQHKKYRKQNNLFVAEGEKLVLDLLPFFKVKHLLSTEQWSKNNPHIDTISVENNLLNKASFLKTPTPLIGIFELPTPSSFSCEELPALVLDRLQDPGNLGTIIRTAAWFGIRHIICSPDTVDAYSPKVVQATMGALAIVNIHYRPIAPFLQELQTKQIKILGGFLKGKSIYETSFTKNSVVVIGNEGQGISEELKPLIDTPITIPSFGQKTPESLNAAVSTAIICSEIIKSIQS